MGQKHRLGMALFIASEAVFFIILILAFVFYRGSPANAGHPNAFNTLDVPRTGIFTFCLLSSSLTIWLAGRAHRRGRNLGWALWLFITIALGAVFLFGQGQEYVRLINVESLGPRTDLFGSTFFTLTGFHGFHVLVGLTVLTILFGLNLGGVFKNGARPVAVEVVSMYWHFVDGVWVVIFPTVYLWSLVKH